MKKAALVVVLLTLSETENVCAEQVQQAGRYQTVAVPASQSQTFPEVFLLDTATGQTWKLFHESGQLIQWLPVRFSVGKDQPMTPLPPSPDAVGVAR
jgi:hypothetical protein